MPYPAGGGAATSAPYTPPQAGTYQWVAAYSGDANNLPVSGTCGAANESVVVRPPAPAPAPATFLVLPPGAGGVAGYCFGRPATIVAAPGQRVITGTPGADVILGGPAGRGSTGAPATT